MDVTANPILEVSGEFVLMIQQVWYERADQYVALTTNRGLHLTYTECCMIDRGGQRTSALLANWNTHLPGFFACVSVSSFCCRVPACLNKLAAKKGKKPSNKETLPLQGKHLVRSCGIASVTQTDALWQKNCTMHNA